MCKIACSAIFIAASTDGLIIITGSSDNKLRRWNANTKESIGGQLRGHTRNVVCFDVSDDGQMIVPRSDVETLRIWNANIGENIGEISRREGSTLEKSFYFLLSVFAC